MRRPWTLAAAALALASLGVACDGAASPTSDDSSDETGSAGDATLGDALSGADVAAGSDGNSSGAADALALDDAAADATLDSGDGGPEPSAALTLGDDSAALALAAEGEALVLRRGEDVLLTFPLDGFELGTVPSLDETLNYDPYFLEPEAELPALYYPPEGLAWLGVAEVAATGGEAGAAALTLILDDGRTSLVTATETAPGSFALHWTPPTGDPPAVYFRLRPRAGLGDAEGFYGLGEVFDHVEHRGRVRAMQFEPSPLESAYNEAHVPVPLLVGTGGWGLFVASYMPGVFAVATEADDLAKVTFGLGASGATGLQFDLYVAEHPLDITAHYYARTGWPGPYAEYALGPWIWRDEVENQAVVEADLLTIRDLDLATTGYWIDRPYASAVNSFDFIASGYPDPPAMMNLADSLGFAMALWHTPYVDPDDEDSAPLYAFAEAEGYFPPLMATAIAKWGPPLDFTNEAAFAWWQDNLMAYADLGVVGYKLDYAEEVLVGGFGIRLPWAFADGSDELTMHRAYQHGYHQAYAGVLPPDGGFLLCRTGAWGDQARGTIIWPGDIDANMAKHGDEVSEPDGTHYVAVGGLPAAVIAGSSLGPSGYPLFGSDTGGYRHSPPDKETYLRWFQHTALSTVMQVGTNTNDLPWAFGDEEAFDPDIVDGYRTWARLHLRLWPYLWTHVQRLGTTGRAIQRPLGLAHPELGVHPDDVYLLGDALLVAAVVEPGVTERTVSLPAGSWTDWWTGEVYAGGSESTLPAPLDRTPLLLRAGAPVPLLRPTIDTLLPVGAEAEVDSYAAQAGPLHVMVTPGGDGSFELFDGTVVTQSEAADGLVLDLSAGAIFTGDATFAVFPIAAEPSSVVGAETWSHDPDTRGGTLTLTLAPGQQAVITY